MSGPGPGASSPSPGPFTPGHHGGRLPPSRGARSFLPLRLLGDTGRRIRSEFDAKDEEYVPKLGHLASFTMFPPALCLSKSMM